MRCVTWTASWPCRGWTACSSDHTTSPAGQWDDPEVAAAYDEVARKAKAAGVLLGVSLEVEYAAWKRRGVDYMAVRSDTGAMLEGFRNSMRAFREA